MITIALGATGSRAAAEVATPQLMPIAAPVSFTTVPVVQQLPTPVLADQTAEPAAEAQPAVAQSLAALVDAQPQPDRLSRELQCLAGAIYFEAKGQTLAGQLAVGRVVVNRAKSGRFPASYCGVVYQRSQFGFIRGSAMPAIARNSRGWHVAVAMAQIADGGGWDSPTEGALYFHATRVSPHWRMIRIAQVDDHIFYR